MGKIIFLKVPNFNPSDPSLNSNQISIESSFVEHKHSITSLHWNDRFNRLCSGDKSGLIIIWAERSKKWALYNLNTSTKSAVVSIKCSASDDFFIILFRNGDLSCCDISGTKRFQISLGFTPIGINFLHESRRMLVCSSKSQFFLLKSHGQFADKNEIANLNKGPVKRFALAQKLVIVYHPANVYIYSKLEDTNPINVTLSFTVSCLSWSSTGNIFAIAGSNENKSSQITIISAEGKILCSVSLPCSNIGSVAFSANRSQLIYASEKSVGVIQLVPTTPWCYFRNNFIYSLKLEESTNYHIVYFNLKSKSMHIKLITKLIALRSTSDFILIAFEGEESSTSFILTNSFGIPFSSFQLPFLAQDVSCSNKYIGTFSQRVYCVWSISTKDVYSRRCLEDISCVAVSNDNLFVSFESGNFSVFSLPDLEQISKFYFDSGMREISFSSDQTRVSTLDVHGHLFFFGCSFWCFSRSKK